MEFLYYSLDLDRYPLFKWCQCQCPWVYLLVSDAFKIKRHPLFYFYVESRPSYLQFYLFRHFELSIEYIFDFLVSQSVWLVSCLKLTFLKSHWRLSTFLLQLFSFYVLLARQLCLLLIDLSKFFFRVLFQLSYFSSWHHPFFQVSLWFYDLYRPILDVSFILLWLRQPLHLLTFIDF